MQSVSPAPPKTRPKYYDVNLLHLPVAGLMSIFHRISGVVMFMVLFPALLFILQETLGSEAGFARWKTYLAHPLAKLVLLGFVWCYLHHFFAGIRFLLLDVHIGIGKIPARRTAVAVMALGVLGTLLVGFLIW
jgi:succinate dehydrogenase / fumarate reductase cytochrome b subunit